MRNAALALLVITLATVGCQNDPYSDAKVIYKVNGWCVRNLGSQYLDHVPNDAISVADSSSLTPDARLVAIEKNVRSSISSSVESNDKVVQRLLESLSNDPASPQRLFRLAFACTEAARQDPESGGSFWSGPHGNLIRILNAMLAQPKRDAELSTNFAHSLEWLKVRFLVAGGVRVDAALIPLGRSLLAAQPGDFQLTRTLAFQLGSVGSKRETDEALQMCRQGASLWPHSPSFYLVRANTYETRWLRLGRHKEDADMAIQSFEDAERRLPPGSFLERQIARNLRAVKQVTQGRA